MTENTKVSAIAFIVIVLGMLGFFAALAFDIFSSANSSAITAPPSPTPHLEAENRVLLDRRRLSGTTENMRFTLSGPGKVQPDETAQGIEEIACYRISFQHPNQVQRGPRPPNSILDSSSQGPALSSGTPVPRPSAGCASVANIS